jgi:hypothetical protein
VPEPDYNVSEEQSSTTDHVSDSSAGKGISRNTNRLSNTIPPLQVQAPSQALTFNQQYNPTIFTLVVLLSIAAGCLAGFAWTKADHSIGSWEDDDFWTLLQSSLLQLASMVPIMFSLPSSGSETTPLQPRAWSWFFLAGGIACSVLSPILYLTVPKEVSGVVSYAGGISQAFLILEAMFLVDKGALQSDAKEKLG